MSLDFGCLMLFLFSFSFACARPREGVHIPRLIILMCWHIFLLRLQKNLQQQHFGRVVFAANFHLPTCLAAHSKKHTYSGRNVYYVWFIMYNYNPLFKNRV